MLDHFDPSTSEAARQLYVAMTRAKRNLIIHYNGNYLESLSAEGLKKNIDKRKYEPVPLLAIQLTLRDVWLDYFFARQPAISNMSSGDTLIIDGDILINEQGQPILRFSKQFSSRMETIKRSGYIPESAKIRSVIYWKKENQEKEIRVILPELYFRKD
jgi:ATP-dependent DNA helicase RecQ